MKMPAFQFYPADWRKDPGIQALDRHDRSVWFDMLCIMHESDERGVLLLAGRPMPHGALSRMLAMSEADCQQTINRLLEYGVMSRRDTDGAIYSRRMVKDEALRQARAKGGESGGEHGVKGKEYGAKGGRPKKATGDNKPPLHPPLNPPPSSSSTSTSTSNEVPHASAAANRVQQLVEENGLKTFTADTWQYLTSPDSFKALCNDLRLPIDLAHETYRAAIQDTMRAKNVSGPASTLRSWISTYFINAQKPPAGKLLTLTHAVDLSQPTPKHELPPEGSDCTGRHIVLPNNGDANLNRIAAQTYQKNFPNATIYHTR
jgi:hypothetical protein